MVSRNLKFRTLLPAAFVLLGAAVFGVAQQPEGGKQNVRPEISTPAPASSVDERPATDLSKFYYEFTQPEFYVHHLVIEHDANGRGRVTFERKRQDAPVIEPLEISNTALARINALWQTLGFLSSGESYQSDRHFPHLGNTRLSVERNGVKRSTELNWTKHQDASALVNEYRRIGDQTMLLFDISVARESQPLNGPKLMEELETLLKRNGLSDPKQMLPILKDITSDEHLPLIASNHAALLIKKIEKGK